MPAPWSVRERVGLCPGRSAGVRTVHPPVPALLAAGARILQFRHKAFFSRAAFEAASHQSSTPPGCRTKTSRTTSPSYSRSCNPVIFSFQASFGACRPSTSRFTTCGGASPRAPQRSALAVHASRPGKIPRSTRHGVRSENNIIQSHWPIFTGMSP